MARLWICGLTVFGLSACGSPDVGPVPDGGNEPAPDATPDIEPPDATRTHWGRRIGGPDSITAIGVAATSRGLLVAGTFVGAAEAEPGGELTSPSHGGLYAATYSTDGALEEARRIAVLNHRAPLLSHFAAFDDGAFVLAGTLNPEFSGDVGFGPADIVFGEGAGSVTLSASPTEVLRFIAGWSAQGELLFVHQTGVVIRGVAAAADGSTWVAGSYESGSAFGTIPITPAAPSGESHLYLARIAADGSIAAALGTMLPFTFEVQTEDILSVAPDGLIVVLGNRLTKFGFDGAVAWQTPASGASLFHAATVRADGTVLAVGGERQLPPTPFDPESSPWFGEWLFVQHLASNGAPMRKTTIGARSYDGVLRILAHPSGGFAIGGHELGSFVLGGGLQQRSYTSQGRRAFVAEFDSSDVMKWAQTAAGTGVLSRLEVHGLAVAEDGAAVLCGVLQEALTFSEGDWSHTFTPEEEEDAFVVKLAGSADELSGVPPNIVRFERSDTEVIEGGSIDLSWEVEGAYLIRVVSEPADFGFATELGSGSISTGPLRGPTRFVLTAVGPGGAARAEAQVAVAPVAETLRSGLRAPTLLTTTGDAFVMAEMRDSTTYDIVSVSLDGQSLDTIASGEGPPMGIAADTGGTYWLSPPTLSDESAVRGVELGGSVRTIATDQGYFTDRLRLTETHVYWSPSRGGGLTPRSIVRAPRDASGPTEVIVSGLPDNSWAFAIGPNHVYYARANGLENAVLARRLDDATTSTVAFLGADDGHPLSIDIDGAELLISTFAPPPPPRTGSPPDVLRIFSVMAEGGAPTLLVESRGSIADRVVSTDSSFVYWTERYPEVRVMRTARAGGAAELISGYDSVVAQSISGPVLVPGAVAWLIKGLPGEAGGALISAPR